MSSQPTPAASAAFTCTSPASRAERAELAAQFACPRTSSRHSGFRGATRSPSREERGPRHAQRQQREVGTWHAVHREALARARPRELTMPVVLLGPAGPQLHTRAPWIIDGSSGSLAPSVTFSRWLLKLSIVRMEIRGAWTEFEGS